MTRTTAIRGAPSPTSSGITHKQTMKAHHDDTGTAIATRDPGAITCG